MTKHNPSAYDQEKTKRQSPAKGQAEMVLIKKENKKPAKKPARATIAPTPKTVSSEPLSLNDPSTNGNVDARIAERAYELYQHRGGHHGQDLEDWLSAEREVLSEELCCS